MKNLLTFAVVAPLVASCSPSTPSPDVNNSCVTAAPPADGPVSTLGLPVNGPFRPIQDGDTLTINYGPQGGHHVFLEANTFATKAGTWTFTFNIAEPDGTPGASTMTIPVNLCAGWTRSQGIRFVLDTGAGPKTISFSARPLGEAPSNPDAGARGPLDEIVSVTLN